MKARIAVALLALILIATASFAQVPNRIQTTPWYNSFRNASTANMLEDDLDLMLGLYGFLDPARINLIEGQRLYTNLANIYSKTEEQFDPSDLNTFLIGGTGNAMNYGRFGLLYDRYAFREPYYVGVDHDGNPAYGVLERDEVTFEDTDGNPGYDVRTVNKTKLSSWGEWGGADYFLGFARSFNDIKAGLVFKRSQESDIYFGSGRNFENHVERYNLATGALTFAMNEKDSGREGYETSLNIVGLSAWRPLNEKMDVSLRLAFGFGPYTFIDEEEYSGDSTYVGGDYYTRAYSDMLTDERSMSMISAGGAYVYKWSDIVTTRADLQFTTRSAKAGSDASEAYSFNETAVVPSIVTNIYDSTANDAITGEYSATDLDFIVKNTVKWERVDFAIGLGLSTGKWEDLATHTRTRTGVTQFRDLNDPTLPTSYVETSNWNETWDYTTQYGYHAIYVPVGLEFAITEPVHFRLGAMHEIYYWDQTDNITLTGGDGRVTVLRRNGDGTEAVSVVPNPLDENVGSSNTDMGHYSNTHYTYGACWKFSDNLQLDFMGFAKLTDLTNWKLSAIIKF